MSHFTEHERAYLTSGAAQLARIATVGADGTLHVTPVGYAYDPADDSIDIHGRNLTRTKKFRDLQRDPRVAVVIDDVLPPWQPRGIEVRGRADTPTTPQPVIRIRPERIVSWGLESSDLDHRHARPAKGHV